MGPFKFLLVFSIACTRVTAQDIDFLTRDLKCFDPAASSLFDMQTSSRTFGEYVTMAEWSQHVTSGDIVTKVFPLESGVQYVVLLATAEDVDATAVEICDSNGEKIEYVYKITELDRNQINVFFTAPISDAYQFRFRTITSGKPGTCMYMGILKGVDDEESY